MSEQTVSRPAFFWDMGISMFGLFTGSLYPLLTLPTVDLTGKTAIVTGSNSGIGLQVALDLARLNARVYLACRNQSKAQDAVKEITSAVPPAAGRVEALALDTSSFSSIREFAKTWESSNRKIDILFHNAGIGDNAGKPFTADGYPSIYETNFLGSFLLTYLLEKHFADDARVILTSSTGHYFGDFKRDFSLPSVKEQLEPGFHCSQIKDVSMVAPSDEYSNTKAMQCAFARLLTQRWARQAKDRGSPIKLISHSFTPGYTFTPIFTKIGGGEFWSDPLFWFLRVTYTTLATPVQQGALTGSWLASTDNVEVVGEGKSGAYWDRMTRRVSKVDLLSQDTLDRMWLRWEADAGIEWR